MTAAHSKAGKYFFNVENVCTLYIQQTSPPQVFDKEDAAAFRFGVRRLLFFKLCNQFLIGFGVHQLFDFAFVRNFHFDNPALAVRVAVD